MTNEEELLLWRRLRSPEGALARDKLFSRYKGFAVRVAKRRYLDRTSGDIELQDLCQLAFAGLLEAIDRFDVDKGVPFRAFAIRRVSGSILDGLTKMSEMREQASFRNRVSRERVQSLSPEDLESLELGDAMRALAEIAVGLAVGFMLEGTGSYLADERDLRSSNAYESVAWKELVNRAAAEVETLPEREQIIIKRHYGDGLTFDQIGELLGVTKGRVSQLHRASLRALKERLEVFGLSLGP